MKSFIRLTLCCEKLIYVQPATGRQTQTAFLRKCAPFVPSDVRSATHVSERDTVDKPRSIYIF